VVEDHPREDPEEALAGEAAVAAAATEEGTLVDMALHGVVGTEVAFEVAEAEAMPRTSHTLKELLSGGVWMWRGILAARSISRVQG